MKSLPIKQSRRLSYDGQTVRNVDGAPYVGWGFQWRIDPGHVDLDITDYGAQITFEDGTGYWLEFRQTQNSAIRLEEVDYLETEELFLSEMEENGLTNYELYDSSELTADILESRKGTTIIERCIGFVTNGQTGDGAILNAADKNYNYISYRSIDQEYCDGTVILTYLIYNPDNNYIDDITERYDFVISREWED